MFLPNQLIAKTLEVAILGSSLYNYENYENYKLDVSVRFCYPNYGCDYTSAIAHLLSSKISKSPLEIAQLIYSEISVDSSVGSKFAIAITTEGMFNFTLTESYIQECLLWIVTADLALNFTPNAQNFPTYTHTQYAYARCCSLLRLSTISVPNLSAPNLYPSELARASTRSLSLNLIAIAESLIPSSSQSSDRVIKYCQQLTAKFLECDRLVISEFNLQLIQITKKVLYILASGYINLSEYL